MGKISVFTMGHTGVVLDPNDLEATVPLDALAIAQNAIQDPKQGHGGAIRKRAGLERFNTEYAGGVIMGGLPMPVAGFGGAPAAGGGAPIGTGDIDDGTSTGTGDMTGSPGGTFDGGAIATTPAGAGLFNGGTPIFSGSRLILIAKMDSTGSNVNSTSWYVAPKNLGTNAVSKITTVKPGGPYQYPATPTFANCYGKPGCIDNIGTTGLYFAADIGEQNLGFTAPTIYRTDGATMEIIATIPRATAAIANVNGATYAGLVSFIYTGAAYVVGSVINLVGGTGISATELTMSANGLAVTSGGAYTVPPTNPISLSGGTGGGGTITGTFGPTPVRNAIMDMHYGSDGFIYVCVKDKYTGQNVAGSAGRVFRVAPLTGEVVEWNLGVTAGPAEAFAHLPYCCCYFDGKLYVGTFPDAAGESAQIYASDGASAVAETSFAPGVRASGYGFHSCMKVYNGRLFVGMGDWNAAPDFAAIWSRKPGSFLDADGLIAWERTLVATGGAAASANYFSSMEEFNGALYASWYGNNGSGKIYKIVADAPGNPVSEAFTITTVLSVASPFRLFVDDGVLYAIPEGDTAGPTPYTTPDGAAWTAHAGALPTFAASARPRAIFFGVDQ